MKNNCFPSNAHARRALVQSVYNVPFCLFTHAAKQKRFDAALVSLLVGKRMSGDVFGPVLEVGDSVHIMGCVCCCCSCWKLHGICHGVEQ